MKQRERYKPTWSPAPDANNVTITTNAGARHWGNPRPDSMADGNQIQKLDSETGFRSMGIKIKVKMSRVLL